LLLLSARSYAKASGDNSFNVTALKYKGECLRLVNLALTDPLKAISDETIATVLMLTVEEVRFKQAPPIETLPQIDVSLHYSS
jgi:hypothetical protein